MDSFSGRWRGPGVGKGERSHELSEATQALGSLKRAVWPSATTFNPHPYVTPNSVLGEPVGDRKLPLTSTEGTFQRAPAGQEV